MAKPKRQNGEYRRLRELSDISGDTNSCSVIAFAAAMDLDYLKAYELLESVGRRKKRGATIDVIIHALNRSDFDWYKYSGRESIRGYKYSKTLTFNNAVKVLDKTKVYMLIGATHMAAMKYGQVVDWAEGRKIRVDEVVEITINQ